jgi:hypothetical protein
MPSQMSINQPNIGAPAAATLFDALLLLGGDVELCAACSMAQPVLAYHSTPMWVTFCITQGVCSAGGKNCLP